MVTLSKEQQLEAYEESKLSQTVKDNYYIDLKTNLKSNLLAPRLNNKINDNA